MPQERKKMAGRHRQGLRRIFRKSNKEIGTKDKIARPDGQNISTLIDDDRPCDSPYTDNQINNKGSDITKEVIHAIEAQKTFYC